MSGAIRASSLGGIMRCRAYFAVSKHGVDAASDMAKFGSAFAKAKERERAGQVLDLDALRLEYGLTTEEGDELKRCLFRIQRDFSDWSLAPERELACDEQMQPVNVNDKRAFLSGRPDVIAFHLTHTNIAQVVDEKTGRQEQLDEFQLLAYVALVFANFPQVDTVDAQFDYVRLGFSTGRVDKDGRPLPYSRLEFESKFWPRIAGAIREAKKRRKEFTVGIQCARCAPWACPAFFQFRQMLQQPDAPAAMLAPNAPAAAKAALVIDWLPKLKVWKAALDELEAVVKSIGEQMDVELGDNLYYGNKPTLQTTFTGDKTLPFFLKLLTPEQLGEVIGPFSKSTVAEVVKTAFPKVKGKYQETVDQLKQLNAINTVERSRVSVYSRGEGESES